MINKEEDIAAYTIKTVDDPKTVNKILYNKPPKNTLSMNEMVALWEKKVGKSLEKTHISEELVLKTQKHPRLISIMHHEAFSILYYLPPFSLFKFVK